MNVSEHLTGEAIEHYRARQSSGAEMLAVQHHIVACPECRARLEAAVELDAAFLSLHRQLAQTANHDALEEDIHLPYEQLSLYVEDKLEEVEREIADSHLSFCGDCAADLADLRQYRVLAAGAAASEPSVAVDAPDVASAWQRFVALLGSFKLPTAATAATAAAAVLLLLVLGGVWLATRNDDALKEGAELARSQPETYPTHAPEVAPSRENFPPPASTSPATISQSPNADSNSVSPAPAQSIATAPRAPSGVTSSDRTPPAPFASQQTALNDGRTQVSLNRRGRLQGLEELTPETRLAVSRALRSRRVETPSALVNFAEGEGGTLMGNSAGGASFALLSPVGKIVREVQPAFRWRPLAGVSSYAVSIVDSTFKPVAQSPALVETTWTPVAPLARGATYYWQVKATLADGTEVTAPTAPAPQARFRVLTESASDDLTQLEKTNPDSRLARGVAYARQGLIEEAEAELEELLKQNPRSPVARDLLRSLRRQRSPQPKR